jgi:hypothetical protein
MPVADYAKTYGAREPGQPGVVGFNLPSGGYFKGSLPKTAAQLPENRPSFVGKTTGPGGGIENVPPTEAGPYAGAPAFVPPTSTFTIGGSAAQPSAQQTNLPGPINAPPKPFDVSIGFGDQPGAKVASVGYGGGMSNEAADRAQAIAMGQPLALNLRPPLVPPKPPPPPPPPKKPDQT